MTLLQTTRQQVTSTTHKLVRLIEKSWLWISVIEGNQSSSWYFGSWDFPQHSHSKALHPPWRHSSSTFRTTRFKYHYIVCVLRLLCEWARVLRSDVVILKSPDRRHHTGNFCLVRFLGKSPRVSDVEIHLSSIVHRWATKLRQCSVHWTVDNEGFLGHTPRHTALVASVLSRVTFWH